MQTILITGTSGFIGFHTAKRLLDEGNIVIGYDNENGYYDVILKLARREILQKYTNFIFYKGNLEDFDILKNIFEKEKPEKVINLAAQAGVRYSLLNPFTYIQSNLVGFHNIIELSKKYGIQKFVYASSSSVYGNSEKQPFSVEDRVDNPISIYAATKKANELIAHTYSHLFNLPAIGLRFFTVYGPRGRPDMAYFSFTEKIAKGEIIDVYNFGKMKRDFTYIDDIVDGVIRCLDADLRYEIFNLGSDNPVDLECLIGIIEINLSKKAVKNYLPIQPGDVLKTSANIEHTKNILGREPKFKIEKGVENFISWYKDYYK